MIINCAFWYISLYREIDRNIDNFVVNCQKYFGWKKFDTKKSTYSIQK